MKKLLLSAITISLITFNVQSKEYSENIWVSEKTLNNWLKNKQVDKINNYLEGKMYSSTVASGEGTIQFSPQKGKSYGWPEVPEDGKFKSTPHISSFSILPPDQQYNPDNPPFVFIEPLAPSLKYRRRPGIPKGKYIPDICQATPKQIERNHGNCPPENELKFFYHPDEEKWQYFLDNNGRYPLPKK